MHSLDTQLAASGRSVAAARKNYDLANMGYKRDLTDYLNVLAAQTQLLRAQDGGACVRAQGLASYATLTAALGGGIDDPSNGPSSTKLAPAEHIGGRLPKTRRSKCQQLPLNTHRSDKR